MDTNTSTNTDDNTIVVDTVLPPMSMQFDDDAFNDLNNPPKDPDNPEDKTKTPEEPEEHKFNADDVFGTGNPDDNTDDTSGESDGDEDEVATSTFNLFVEKNIFTEDEEFDGKWETLMSKVEDIPKTARLEVVQSSPDVLKDLIYYGFSKAENGDVSVDDIKTFIDNYTKPAIEVLNTKIETTDNARDYLKVVYAEKLPNHNEDDIDSMLDTLEDKGENIIINAAKAELNTKKAAAQKYRTDSLLAEQKVKDDNLAAQNKFVEDFGTSIKSTKWSNARQATILKEYSTGITHNKFEQISSNPESLVQLTNFLTYFDPKTNTFDLSEFVKSANTTKVETTKKNNYRDSFNKNRSQSRKAPKNNTDEFLNSDEWSLL